MTLFARFCERCGERTLYVDNSDPGECKCMKRFMDRIKTNKPSYVETRL